MVHSVEEFGRTADGTVVNIHTLQNDKGQIRLIDYGATIQSIQLQTPSGPVDVVLGYDTLEGYLNDKVYFGCTVGPVCNRIGGGEYTLNGVTHKLCINNGPNHLHSGPTGWAKRVWQSKTGAGDCVQMWLTRARVDGYPGAVTIKVDYRWTADCKLHIRYEALVHDAESTPLSITNHTYFNLSGHNSGNIYDQTVQIKARHYLPTDDNNLATGEIRAVQGTPYDLREGANMGDRIPKVLPRLGFDGFFVIDNHDADAVVVRAKSASTNVSLTVRNRGNLGVQFYTGSYLSGVKGKAGAEYNKHGGFCLEAHRYPNAVNQPDFPSTVTSKGDTYDTEVVWEFAVQN